MKKLLLTIIGTLLISGGMMSLQLAYADDDKPPLYNATFDVGTTLNLCERDTETGDCIDSKQDASYFKKGAAFEENRSPIVKLIVYVIEFVTKIIGSIAMILIIIGGFVLMVSQGNQQTLDKGKEIIKYAFFGLMITFASYTIGVFIQSVFYQ